MILLFAVSAILVLALAVPASAKNIKIGPGEPLLTGSDHQLVLHCGPLLGLHGAIPLASEGGNCVEAPPE